jgi:ABC-type transporter Mla subunit MlaD
MIAAHDELAHALNHSHRQVPAVISSVKAFVRAGRDREDRIQRLTKDR